MTWIIEVRNDTEEMKIDGEERREELREKIRKFNGFEEKWKKKTGVKWTEEREKQHGERREERRAENNHDMLFHMVHSWPKSKKKKKNR